LIAAHQRCGINAKAYLKLELATGFHRLVPAPNEAYSNLFWPGDTTALDAYIKRKAEEEERRKEATFTTTNWFSLSSWFRYLMWRLV
jgi:hypothetical protein